MGGLAGDLRYALRGLVGQIGFTLLAVTALGLGIGAATAIFSVVYNVMLNPFPYRAADRIVMVEIHDLKRSGPGGRSAYTPREFLEYAHQNHVFEDSLGSNVLDVLYTTPEGTERLQGDEVTGNAFNFLGMAPLMGRGLLPEDARPNGPPVFVMSYKMWVKYFDRDPHILGRTFILNGQSRTLVGIMPPRFTFFAADLWLPLDPDPAAAEPDGRRRFFLMEGRLKPGVTLAQAAADFDTIARRMAKLYPDLYPEKFSVQVETLTDAVIGRFRTTLMVLIGAVGLLLLIACTNVANMLLARATAREREIAIRAALGASRWRIVRQLLVETALIASGGAVVGCGLAFAGLKLLVRAIPEDTIPRESVIELNLVVLGFCLLLAIVSTMVAGLAPAIHATRNQLADPLKDTAKGAGGGYRQGRLRSALVVAEIALSLVLLGGAGLLMRTMVALETVDLGLNPDNVLVVRLPLPRGHYKTAAAKKQFFSQALTRIAALPGVVAVTETSTLPPYGGIGSEVEVPGKAHAEKWRAIYQLCSEGYFPTLQLKLLRGRTFTPNEVDGARKVAVVNQTLVRKFFGTEDPIGRTIVLNDLAKSPDPVPNPVFEIVGVISDAKNQGIQDAPIPEAFIPYTVTASYERGILVRTAREPMAMLNDVRREIWSVDRGVPLTLTGTMEGFLKSFTYSGPEFALTVLAVFAIIGLVLVGIGTYSVVSYTVSRQTREIGIRMALGAARSDVFAMVLRSSGIIVGIGLAVGIAASLGANRLIASQLFGVEPYDVPTLAVVVVVILMVALLACGIPARRATRVDPAVSLRYE
jgi:putative ABC transport system permease protein